ncbi:hypothetical protein TcCL_ESM07935 [Trypanosoma cruzi]|nr:hypothetical protein TcCL_ESM07935 [Trypanosoma cruzi]
MLCSCFYFFASCVCRHKQNANCSGFGCFFCSVCWRLRVAAVLFFRGHEEKEGGRERPRVSFPADAVVVPVDVSCAPSDGSLSYRVRVCVCGRGRSVLLPVLRLSMSTILSAALMCAFIAGMVSWVLCAMWPMRCTHVATVLPAVQGKRKGPPLPSR